MARHSALSLLAALAVLGAAGRAAAAQACGYSSSGWNAPNGAVVFTRGESGPIASVMNALGEYRTHSILSHGPGKAATHSTMRTPAQNSWPAVCGTPINVDQLRYGRPGLERVNQGGIYRYIYGADTSDQGTKFVAYQLGDAQRAAAIGDHILWDYGLVAQKSEVDGAQSIFRPWVRGGVSPYSLYQYRDSEGTPYGDPSINNGMVCSTFLAFASLEAGDNLITPFTYSHASIASAANSLFSSVKNECKSSLGFWGNIGASVGCPFYDVCGSAGNQVTNCMATNGCGSTNGDNWKAVRDNPNATATSISPDRLGGWSGHSWGGPEDPVWSIDWNNDVQWNSGGNVYGCWY
ncbi:MAG TPA: hypothetical protein VFS43_46030 [Polyangiaceae bacterium]|nr:hypothetical protein [Polyangiaceae bacterium]